MKCCVGLQRLLSTGGSMRSRFDHGFPRQLTDQWVATSSAAPLTVALSIWPAASRCPDGNPRRSALRGKYDQLPKKGLDLHRGW
jgi:hypothetical protein